MVIQLWHGDCLERLKGISDGVVSAIVADPPLKKFLLEWSTLHKDVFQNYKVSFSGIRMSTNENRWSDDHV